MRGFMGAALVILGLTVGMPGRVWASDTGANLCDGGDGSKCHTCGAFDYGFPWCAEMLDITLQKANEQCLTGTCIGSGKMVVNLQQQEKYVDAHNEVHVTDWLGGFGKLDPWFGNGPIRKYQIVSLFSGATVQMGVIDRGTSQFIYQTGSQPSPTGYTTLQHIGILANNQHRLWENTHIGPMPIGIRKNVNGQTVLKNSAGQLQRVTFLLGKVEASVGGYYNNLITLYSVYVTP